MKKTVTAAVLSGAASVMAAAPAAAQGFTGLYIAGAVSTTAPIGVTEFSEPESLASTLQTPMGDFGFSGQVGYTFDVGGFIVGGEVGVESWGMPALGPRPAAPTGNLSFNASAVFGYQVSDSFALFAKAGIGTFGSPLYAVGRAGNVPAATFFTAGIGGEFGLGNGLSIRASYDLKAANGYAATSANGSQFAIRTPTVGTATVGLVFRP